MHFFIQIVLFLALCTSLFFRLISLYKIGIFLFLAIFLIYVIGYYRGYLKIRPANLAGAAFFSAASFTVCLLALLAYRGYPPLYVMHLHGWPEVVRLKALFEPTKITLHKPYYGVSVQTAQFMRKVYGIESEFDQKYSENKDYFIKISDVIGIKYLPDTTGDRQNTPFFGMKSGLVPDIDGDQIPEMITMSYGDYSITSSKCTMEKCIGAMLFSKKMMEIQDNVVLSADNSAQIEWTGDLFDIMSKARQVSGYVFPMRTDDLDGDGVADVVIGATIFPSRVNGVAAPYAEGSKRTYQTVDAPTAITSVLSGRHPTMVLEDGPTISLARLVGDRVDIRKTHTFPLTDAGLVAHAFPIRDVDGDGDGDLVVVAGNTAYCATSGGDYNFQACLTLPGSERNAAKVTSQGDFLGDGVPDLWIVGDDPGNVNGGAAWLVSGKQLWNATEPKPIDGIALLKIKGNPDLAFKPGDQIGASISLRAGDFDGDRIPDFMAAAHRHLSTSGAMYFMPGKRIRQLALTGSAPTIDVMSSDVVRVRSWLASQAAPGLIHGEYDYTADGHSDVLIAVDADSEAGPFLGAYVLLDGRKLSSRPEWLRARGDNNGS